VVITVWVGALFGHEYLNLEVLMQELFEFGSFDQPTTPGRTTIS
jgi:hypothetical protein